MMPDLVQLNVEILREFPGFSIKYKADSLLMKLINIFLMVVTFGAMRQYMTSFITTLGQTVYVPSDWDSLPATSQAAVLRHERVHMRQARKYSRPLFSFLYLFAYFPVGLAWWRAKFEKEAYEESLRAYHEYGRDIKSPGFRYAMIAHFTTGEYAWMWPWKADIETWYDETVERILKG